MSQTLSLAPNTEDVVERGEALFQARIRPLVSDYNPYDFLAIDIHSGDFEVASDDLSPGDRLRTRHSNAVIYLRRVGDEAAYSVGWGYAP